MPKGIHSRSLFTNISPPFVSAFCINGAVDESAEGPITPQGEEVRYYVPPWSAEAGKRCHGSDRSRRSACTEYQEIAGIVRAVALGCPALYASSQPPVNPARRSPVTRYGHHRMRCQSKPERKFSVIKTIGPWLRPRCHGDTHNGPWPASVGKVGLKVALKPYGLTISASQLVEAIENGLHNLRRGSDATAAHGEIVPSSGPSGTPRAR